MADAIILPLRIFLWNALFLIGCRATGEKNNENLQFPSAPHLGSGHSTYLGEMPMPPKQQQKAQHPPHMPHLGAGLFRLENGKLNHGRPPKEPSNSLRQLPESTNLLGTMIYNPLLPRQASSIPHHTGVKYDAIHGQGQKQRDLEESFGEIDEKYKQPPPLPLSEWSKPQLKLKRILSSLPNFDGQLVKPASAIVKEEADDDAAVAAALMKLRERTEKEPIVYKRRKKQK